MIDILRMPYVQKVLPLVYDESLSYYELLCKVLNKLNDTIKEVNDQGDDIAQLKAEMAEVKYWIDHFDVEGFARLTGADFLGDVTTTGSMSAAQGFTGNLTGNVVGDVLGNLTGDVTGDVTGDLTGNVVGNVRGNVTGTLTGSVNGDVNGNVRGNVTGNVAGNVNGTLTGDSRGTHYGGVVGNVTGDVTGNADTATQLETARSLVVDLESTVSDLFDGSANADLGIKGVLDVAHGGTGNASVDTAPTAGSTKMVTSGGVKTALDGKQDTLTFDSAPTQGSTNPVTSGGVYSAIAGAGVGVVESVFGRQGVIVATAGDYDAVQVDYDNTNSGLVATNVQAAIDEVLAKGGLKPIIDVVGNDGDTVVISDGTTTYTGVIASGHYTVTIGGYGTYTIIVNSLVMGTVVVDTVKIYEFVINYGYEVTVTALIDGVVEATDGTETVSGNIVNGSATIYVHNLGSYTFTLKDTDEYDNTAVTLETKSVTIIDGTNTVAFTSYYIYNNGDECTDITGGWTSYFRNNDTFVAYTHDSLANISGKTITIRYKDGSFSGNTNYQPKAGVSNTGSFLSSSVTFPTSASADVTYTASNNGYVCFGQSTRAGYSPSISKQSTYIQYATGDPAYVNTFKVTKVWIK